MRRTKDYRHRAAKSLEDALRARPALPDAAIPITTEAWDRFVDRLKWLGPEMLDVSERVNDAASSTEFHPIRQASEALNGLLRRTDAALQAAAMFQHDSRPSLVKLHSMVGAQCMRWWRDLTGQTTTVADRPSPGDLALTVRSLRSRDSEPIDPWQAALGVRRERLTDPRGIVTVPLVLASFWNRLDVLRDRVETLFEPLAVSRLDPLKAVTYATALLEAADPIECVQAAIHVRRLLATTFAADPERTAAALRALLAGVERSRANIQMILDNQQRMRETDRAQTRAALQLDNYRRMMEGQVRPWCWVLVCLHTGASGRAPMLSRLVDRLAATDDDLARAFLNCIEIEARNDAAHEDAYWDARRQVLVGSAGDIDTDYLAALTARGQGLMSGAELGWALACGDLPELTAMTQRGASIAQPMILQMDAALSRFATNNLEVDEWGLDIDTLTVTIKDLPFEKYNPCAQAVLEASMLLPEVERFAVRLRGCDGPAVVATKGTLKETAPLWFAARGAFATMPSAVFLPLLVESRLEVEAPQTAGRAAAWLALNEAVHCLEDVPWPRFMAGMGTTEVLRQPALGLAIAAEALRQAITLTETKDDPTVVRAQRAIEGASVFAREAITAAGEGRRNNPMDLARMGQKIYALWESIPACAPLPTVDHSPLAIADGYEDGM